jgi:hypothetical protein
VRLMRSSMAKLRTVPSRLHPAEPRWTCHRDRIADAPQSDRMEFQAAYVGAALLAPSYSVKLWAAEITIREAKQPPVPAGSDLGRAMIERLISDVGSPRKPRGSAFCA